MKKLFKVIIAFVIIACLAVGAYFIIDKTSDNSKVIFNNMYELEYNVKDGKKNVVEEVNSVVNDMLNIIDTKGIDAKEAKTDLLCFVNLNSNYGYIKNEILANGSFLVENNAVSQYINSANNSYKNVKDIYLKSYKYLNDTYFKIVDTAYNVETMKTYIINFNVILKKSLNDLNSFYFNSGVAYSHLLKNTMLKNNAYKLQVEYLSHLLNNCYNSTENKDAYNNLISQVKTYLSGDFVNEYFDNKTTYDNLIDSSVSLDVSLLCEKIVTEEIESYVSGITDEDTKLLINDYMTKVARR